MGAAQMQATRAHVTSTSLLTTLTLPRFWPPFYENTLISPLGYILPSMISLLKLQYFLYLNVCFFIGDAKTKILILATPWTAAYKAPLSMGFSRQEYWSGLPLPSPVMRVEPY